jgi:hypothetical protein
VSTREEVKVGYILYRVSQGYFSYDEIGYWFGEVRRERGILLHEEESDEGESWAFSRPYQIIIIASEQPRFTNRTCQI